MQKPNSKQSKKSAHSPLSNVVKFTTSALKSPSRSPHRSFRRTYREEIADDFEAPNVFTLAGETFALIFRNWRLFGGLLLLAVLASTLFVGLLSQSSLDAARSAIESNSSEFSSANLGNFAKASLLLLSTLSTGGLSASLSEGQGLILLLVFVTIFLISIYLARFLLAGEKVTLRAALYNSMTPFLSVFVILLVILVELIPVFVTIILYSAALQTDFFATPFYALIFLVFAGLMLLLSGYLVTSSLVALVAATVPGLYPREALVSARELIFGRRLKLLARLLFLFVIIAFVSVVIMLPIILLDSFLKANFDFLANIPLISFFLLATTYFSFIYISVYLYLYYRKML